MKCNSLIFYVTKHNFANSYTLLAYKVNLMSGKCFKIIISIKFLKNYITLNKKIICIFISNRTIITINTKLCGGDFE